MEAPHDVVQSYARRFTELGGDIRQQTPAIGIDDPPDLARLMPLVAAEAEIAGGWSGMFEVSPDWNPIMGMP